MDNSQPLLTDDSYRMIPIQESGEPLVSLSNLSQKIKTYPYYYHQKVPGALDECYLREGAAHRLAKAAEKLPQGHFFLVLDGWRPYEIQLALYRIYKQTLRKKSGMSEKEALDVLSKFVAYPSDNPDKPSPHMTGGAIDLTIANESGWLDMGTGFDDFTEKAQTDWFEINSDRSNPMETIRNNRKYLDQLMTDAGFKNYEQEWWHFDYGNQRWAMLTNNIPIYRGIKKSEFI